MGLFIYVPAQIAVQKRKGVNGLHTRRLLPVWRAYINLGIYRVLPHPTSYSTSPFVARHQSERTIKSVAIFYFSTALPVPKSVQKASASTADTDPNLYPRLWALLILFAIIGEICFVETGLMPAQLTLHRRPISICAFKSWKDTQFATAYTTRTKSTNALWLVSSVIQ